MQHPYFPVFFALVSKDMVMFEFLCRRGCNMERDHCDDIEGYDHDMQPVCRQTPMRWALRHGKQDAVVTLLAYGYHVQDVRALFACGTMMHGYHMLSSMQYAVPGVSGARLG